MLRTVAPSRGAVPPGAADTIAKARALRAEHALAAAYQAHRVEQARAAFHHPEAARWEAEYGHSVARCRLLGEVIRAGSRRSATAAPTASSVIPLIRPEPTSDVHTTGEAA
jgi:hypothetical protein